MNAVATDPDAPPQAAAAEPLLEVRGLVMHFKVGRNPARQLSNAHILNNDSVGISGGYCRE